MSDCWREILIDVEPRGKEFRLGIDRDALVGDVLAVIQDRCKEEGVELEGWARSTVGDDFQLVLLRKAEGNAVLAPGMTLGDIDPEIADNEKFKLGAQPVVGALPAEILNRRVGVLIDDVYAESLDELYRREGWTPVEPSRDGTNWDHELLQVEVVDHYPDGAYRTLRVRLRGVPGVVAVDERGGSEIGWNHTFEFALPRDYPADLKVDITNRTALAHPRFRGAGKNACYVVNGEVDRIIVDLLYLTLLRPDRVRPPSLYEDADWGVNRAAMKWYIEAGPERVHGQLLDQLRRRRGGSERARVAVLADAVGSRPRVAILDD